MYSREGHAADRRVVVNAVSRRFPADGNITPPGPVALDMSDEALRALLRDRPFGVLVTLKRDGRPQLSNVLHHYDESEGVLLISVTDGRAKTANLRRDPRATYHVTTEDGWQFAVAEGVAELTPVAQAPDDDTVNALVDLYRHLRGEHSDWDEYRAAMVADRRLVLRINIDRVYGQAR